MFSTDFSMKNSLRTSLTLATLVATFAREIQKLITQTSNHCVTSPG